MFERFALLDAGDVAMSRITLAELQYGVAFDSGDDRHRSRAALDALLEDIPALPFDAAAARAFGRMASQMKFKRNKAIDNLIAAHAISLDAVVITNNEADFKVYPGLRVENWLSR